MTFCVLGFHITNSFAIVTTCCGLFLGEEERHDKPNPPLRATVGGFGIVFPSRSYAHWLFSDPYHFAHQSINRYRPLLVPPVVRRLGIYSQGDTVLGRIGQERLHERRVHIVPVTRPCKRPDMIGEDAVRPRTGLL